VKLKRVVLESPFAGNIPRNIAYARLCLKDSLHRGEAPLASHLLYTQPGVLDDQKPEERKLGIAAGHVWTFMADAVVVYTDFGFSSGMDAGIREAARAGTEVEFRQLGPAVVEELERLYPLESGSPNAAAVGSENKRS
jgi:hypothetical protein